MKQATQEKRKLVKCRFPQKFKALTPSFPAATTAWAAVTRKVSEEGMDAPPTQPEKEEQVPPSPQCVVWHDSFLIRSDATQFDPNPAAGGRFSPPTTISQVVVVEATARSISDSSLEHAPQPPPAPRSPSGFLKRRAKSMCLTELASPPAPSTESCLPNNTSNQRQAMPPFCEPSPKSAAAWGLFIDLDEHHHHVSLLVDRDRRRPLKFRRRPRLKGFVLPDIDEATSQLGNLSF